MRLDRRTFLTSLSAVGVAGLPLGQGATSAGAIRVRRSIADLAHDDPDVAALRRAIPLMRRSGAWETQIALHTDMRNRQHTSWRFLPWHRLQLARFEEIVAKVSGKADFALPYWDWGRDSFPKLFFDDPAFRIRGRTAPRGLVMNSGWFTTKLDDPFETYFGAPRDPGGVEPAGPRYAAGSAEWSGHNLAHGYIGGDMNNLQRAPNDPIFWLHHANIDRCWTLWRRRNPDEIYPQAWRDELLSGLVGADGRPAPTVTADSTIETTSFGYVYPSDPSLTPPVEPRRGGRTARDERQSLTARLVAANAGVVEIPASLAERRPVRAVGFIEMECAAHTASIVSVTARRPSDGAEVFHDTIFAVPMGTCFEAAAYRINLDRIWENAAGGALEIRVQIDPIRRSRGRGGGILRRVIVDADVAGAA